MWIIRTYLPKLVERLDYLGWCRMVNASLHFGIQYCKVLSNCRTTKPTLLKCNKSLYSKHSEIPHSLIFEAGLHLFFLGLMGLNFYRVYLAWNNRNCTNCVEFLGLSWKWSYIHFFSNSKRNKLINGRIALFMNRITLSHYFGLELLKRFKLTSKCVWFW